MSKQPNFDVWFGNEGYVATTIQRTDANDLVARFGSPEKGDTNLDLNKVTLQKSFRGGQFQPYAEDPERASSITGLYYNDLDGKLYFTPRFKTVTEVVSTSFTGVHAYCWFQGKVWLSLRSEAPGAATNRLVRLDPATGLIDYTATLPAAILNGPCPITTIVAHGTKLFISGVGDAVGIYQFIYRWDAANDTFARIHPGYGSSGLGVLNDKLYAIDEGGGNVHLFSGEFGAADTATFAHVCGLGANIYNNASVQGVRFYNNALYIAKTEGLFRFDGVGAQRVIDTRESISPRNFETMTVYNGRLYFSIRDVVYKFDGTNLETLHNFTGAFTVRSMMGGEDRLWLLATSDATFTSSDKFGNVNRYKHSLFCYNDVSWYEYAEFNTALADQVVPFVVAGGQRVIYCTPLSYYNGSNEIRSDGFSWSVCNLANEFTGTDLAHTSARSAALISSLETNGYNNVTKTLTAIIADCQGFLQPGVHLYVDVEITKDGITSAWQRVWSSDLARLTGGPGLTYFLHDQSSVASPNLWTEPLVYNSIRYRLSASIDANAVLSDVPRLRSFNLGYTLQSRVRNKWRLTLNLDTTLQVNGARVAASPNVQRNNIIRARRLGLPLIFLDVDASVVIDRTADTVKIRGTGLFTTGDTLAFASTDDGRLWVHHRVEVLEYNEDPKTTLLKLLPSGHRAGLGGRPDLQFGVGSEVRKSYVVQITGIPDEQIILDERTGNIVTGETDIPSLLTVDIEEL